MGILQEVGGDFMKLIATLGVIGALVLMFFVWGSMGTIGIVLLLVVVAGGFGLYWYLKNN